jgi:hypothetical protein
MKIKVPLDSIVDFTVPLFIPGNDSDVRDRIGTGVLVQLKDQYFVLTAGHCVDAWAATKENDVLILILGEEQIPMRVVSWKSHYEKGKNDFGFIKLSPENVDVIATAGKAFLPEQQLDTSDTVLIEPIIISGYPECCNDGTRLQHVMLHGNVHPTQDPRYPENLYVWVSKEELDKVSNPEDPWLYSDTSGISGGGCWVIRNTSCGEETISTAYLVGIHFHADRSNLAGHKKFESKVLNHINLTNDFIRF